MRVCVCVNIYLFICKSCRERGIYRERTVPSAAWLPKWLKWHGLGQAEARSKDLNLPFGCRSPVIFAISPAFLAESWIECGTTETKIGVHIGYWHWRQILTWYAPKIMVLHFGLKIEGLVKVHKRPPLWNWRGGHYRGEGT